MFRSDSPKVGEATPVIVITGDDTPEAHSRALRLGAKAYLAKPVDQSTLLAAIGIAIGGVSPCDRPDHSTELDVTPRTNILGETR